MQTNRSLGKGAWTKISAGASYKIWCGMTFEAICLKHIDQIKKALDLDDTETRESTWRYVPKKGEGGNGTQIDLLIDRKDRNINLCEIKFYTGEFQIDKAYAKDLQQKMDVFRKQVKPKKTLFLTMITTYGVKENMHSTMVDAHLTMDALFT